MKKRIFIALYCIGICFLVASWAASQSVAKDCSYSPVLGFVVYHTDTHPIYFPLAYWIWKYKFALIMPKVLASVSKYFQYALFFGFFISIIVNSKVNNISTSHGSAEWAKEKDIKKAGFDNAEGTILGWNPYKHTFLRHDGPEHIMVMAPTRTGKGVGFVIPGCILWKHSLFVLDVKKENWNSTAYYRRYYLKQKVIKYEPFCQNGTSAHWNPLIEIRMMTPRESGDILNISNLLADPDGKGSEGSNKHWIVTAVSMISTVITHLLYVHYRLQKLPPTMNDVALFLASPNKTHDEQLDDMLVYPHITPDDFFNNNIFERIYSGGDSRQPYVDLVSFCENLPEGEELNTEIVKKIRLKHLNRQRNELKKKLPKNIISKLIKRSNPKILQLKKELYNIEYDIKFIDNTNLSIFRTLNELKEYYWQTYEDGNMDFESEPFSSLLVHPTVASGAAEMKNRDAKEEASVLSTAMEAFTIYRDPLISKHTSKSDFVVKDLLDPNQAVSLYLATSPDDLQTLAPLIRLLITLILNKNMEEMKFKKKSKVSIFKKIKEKFNKLVFEENTSETKINKKPKKQRCLLMLDEFPQLGKIEKMQMALAVMAGYGLKAEIICQDINQLNGIYGENNSILSNCHIRAFLTPNDSKTPETISKMLGKRTISVTSRSDNGKAFNNSSSTSQIARELMTPDEVNKLSSEQSIIFVAGQKPIMGKKLFYYNEPFFNRRIDAYPYAEDENNPLKSDIATAITSYNDILPAEYAKTIDISYDPININNSDEKELVNTNETKNISVSDDATLKNDELLAMLSALNINNSNDLKAALGKNEETDELSQKDDDIISDYLGSMGNSEDKSIMIDSNQIFENELNIEDKSDEKKDSNTDPILAAASAAFDKNTDAFGGSDFD